MSLAGWATEQGTADYCKRFDGTIPSAHYRQADRLWLSSIGIGTYLGDHDEATDELYKQAVVRTLQLGGNVIDTAVNYRFQRSERAIGAALRESSSKEIGRSEIVVSTKGGFIPFDGTPPRDIRNYFSETFVKPGIATASDVVAGCHCMSPSYLLNQLECSLKNLNLECIDIYYLHNPETQLGEISREAFDDRLLKAFEALEGAVSSGKIRMYGTATWNGYRNDPTAKDYLSLLRVVEIASKAAGKDHHFKVIQLPFNLGMAEALTKKNQEVKGENISALEAAQTLGIAVMSSASILQGQLTRNLPPMIGETFPGLATDAQRSLQFTRSTPGVSVALVGMKQMQHVEENLKLAQTPPAPWEQYVRLFQTS